MGYFHRRMNRATYWASIGIFVATTIVIGLFTSTRSVWLEAMLVVFGVPRLRDLGRTGWLIVIPLAFEFGAVIADVSQLLPTNTASTASGIVLWGAAVLLGVIPGQRGSNRFGGPPASGVHLRNRSKADATATETSPSDRRMAWPDRAAIVAAVLWAIPVGLFFLYKKSLAYPPTETAVDFVIPAVLIWIVPSLGAWAIFKVFYLTTVGVEDRAQ
jgi:uncharacterized membrane protein YhaH (DUF805 family)